jgi:hypothetical protein
MAGLGRKTFSPGDVLTSSDVQGYLMDQSVMVFAGTAARTSAIPSPSAGMVAYSTATGLQLYNGTAWVAASTGYGVATGGSATSITVSSQAYTLLSFTSDANLVVSTAGLFDVLVVGSGAGGGFIATYGGGGGGGGGVIGIQTTQTVYLPAATYAVDIGAGGASETSGLNTAIGTVIAVPGGGVAGTSSNNATKGSSGSSGGGGIDSRPGGSTVFSVGGFAGGNSSGGATAAGAGGGGANGAGGNATGNTGGTGGNGIDIYPFVNSVSVLTNPYYAGAGGGGAGAVTPGAAGLGGVAGKTSGAGNNGVNYGSGGGGGMTAGGQGQAGLVLIRFKV